MDSKDLEKILPPPPEAAVYKVALCGILACFAAMILGLIQDSGPSAMSTIRLLLVAGGCLAAGSALSMRSNLPFAWGLAAITFLLAYPGLPSHWDSARYVAEVGAAVSLGGALSRPARVPPGIGSSVCWPSSIMVRSSVPSRGPIPHRGCPCKSARASTCRT